MTEDKPKFSTKKHGLGVFSIILLVIGIIIFLASFTGEYITQQAGTMLYATFFVLLSILFQLMKIAAYNNTKTE